MGCILSLSRRSLTISICYLLACALVCGSAFAQSPRGYLEGDISTSPPPPETTSCDSGIDACGVCGGDGSSCAGCDGVPNSGKANDLCGVCDGDNSSCRGCDGGINSGAVFDQCGVCGGDNSTCTGCDGVVNSGKTNDACNVCGGDGSSCAGCDGVPNSAKLDDACGVCGGDGSSCAGCDGVSNSGKIFDACGVCGGDGSSCAGCDGVANSGKVVDACSVCGGDGSSCAGCDGVPNSGKVVDACGVCDGDGSSCAGCDGISNSGKVFDLCGVCDGNGSSCAGCDGVANSGVRVDVCGVCGGDGTSCLGCDGVANSGLVANSCGECGVAEPVCGCNRDQEFFDNPLLLVEPAIPDATSGPLDRLAYQLDQQYQFTQINGQFFEFKNGWGYKWFRDATRSNKWYYLTPEGEIYLYGRFSQKEHEANPTLVATLRSVPDECGVCSGDGSSCAGCDGVSNSGIDLDVCGVCGGDGTSCLGCDGVPNSGKVNDDCGVCGGDNSTCSCVWGESYNCDLDSLGNLRCGCCPNTKTFKCDGNSCACENNLICMGHTGNIKEHVSCDNLPNDSVKGRCKCCPKNKRLDCRQGVNGPVCNCIPRPTPNGEPPPTNCPLPKNHRFFKSGNSQNGGRQCWFKGLGNCEFALECRNVRGGFGCFAPDSPVKMADGSERRIDDVWEGDYIWNSIENRGIRVTKVVGGPEKKPLIVFQLESGEVKVTTGHPMVARGAAEDDILLKRADQVIVGDELLGSDGQWNQVLEIGSHLLAEGEEVINLEIEGGEGVVGNLIEVNGIVTGDYGLQRELGEDSND